MATSVLPQPWSTSTALPPTMPLVLQPPSHFDGSPLLLTPGEYVLGSAADADFCLDADGVAEEHAVLVVNRRGVGLRALDPRTWVNDFLVSEATLRRGDRLSFGPLTFVLRAATADDLLAQVPVSAIESVASSKAVSPPVTVVEPAPVVVPVEEATTEMLPTDPVASRALDAVEKTVEEPPVVIEPEVDVELETVAAVVPPSAATVDTIDEQQMTAWRAEQAEEHRRSKERHIELAALTGALEEREARLLALENRLTRRESELDGRRDILTALEAELENRESALSQERKRLETVAAAARAELTAEAEKQAVAWNEWETTQQRLSSELNTQFAALQAAEQTCAAAQAKLAIDQETWEVTRRAWQAERTEWDARRQEQHQQLTAWEAESEQQRTALTAEREQLAQQRAELDAEACQYSAAHRELLETQQILQRDRRLFAEQQSAWMTERETQRMELQERRRQLEAEQSAWEAGSAERVEWETRRCEQQRQLAEWEIEAQQQRTALTTEREQLAAQRAELHAEACNRAAAHRELFEARQVLQRERRLFTEQQSAWMEEREAQWIELQERRRRLDADEREITELHRQAKDAHAEALATRESVQVVSVPVLVEPPPPAVAETSTFADPETLERAWDEATFEQSFVTGVVSRNEDAPTPVEAMELPHSAFVPMETSPASYDGTNETSWSTVDSPMMLDRLAADCSVDEVEPVPFRMSQEMPAPYTEIDRDLVLDAAPAYDQVAFTDQAGFTPPSAESDTPSSELYAPPFEPYALPAEHFAPHADGFAASAQHDATPAEHVSSPPEHFGHQGEEAEESNLHSELAKMFGLPEDFGHHHPVPDEPAAAPIAVKPVSAFDLTPPSSDFEAAAVDTDVTVEPEEDAWRTQLAEMLANPSVKAKPEPIEPAVAAEPVVAPPPPPPTPKATHSEEEDSIAAYMERLLARNNMGSSGQFSSPPSPVVESPAATTTTMSAYSPSMSESMAEMTADVNTHQTNLPLPEPRQRIDKDEVRAAMQSFRQVANLSARSAIAQHSTKTLRGEITVQGGLAGLSVVAGIAYWGGPLWGIAAQPLPGTVCLIAAGWMSWQIYRSVNRLHNWNPGDVLEVPLDEVEAAVPSEESEIRDQDGVVSTDVIEAVATPQEDESDSV